MAEETEDKQPLWKNPMSWGVGVTLIILVAAAYLGASETCPPDFSGGESCPTKWSLFLASPPNEVGDALAGFAGALAFVWIIVTVSMQSIELREQRKVLSAQKNEMEMQRFEVLFGELFSNFSNFTSTLEMRKQSTLKGRAVFDEFSKEMKGKFRLDKRYPSSAEPLTIQRIKKAYEEVWKSYESDLGLYLRFLYNIYRTIDESGCAKEHHSKLIRSLLSRGELELIFYNCFSDRGENFIRYVDKHNILDNLPEDWFEEKWKGLFETHAEQVRLRKEWS